MMQVFWGFFYVFIKISSECKLKMNPFGGRLAEYKYYDMAPIIEKVLNLDI